MLTHRLAHSSHCVSAVGAARPPRPTSAHSVKSPTTSDVATQATITRAAPFVPTSGDTHSRERITYSAD
nr:MAG TPA: hypothetical protein [Caudoviricetes sp.]